MSCPDCPSGVEVEAANFNSYIEPDTNGNEVFGIPLKQGEPLSTSCQRANIIGSIPEVIRHPAFTVVGGRIAANKISNGGIEPGAMFNFFNRRSSSIGCFGDVPLYGNSCS